MEKKSVFSFTLEALREYFVSLGLTKFGADQVYHWVYKQSQYDMEKWSNVSKKIKAHIEAEMDFSLPKVVWEGLSKDGTRKFLLAMGDKQTVEAVVISARNNRLTLCLSSQIGCAIGCTFCHTATMGLIRHLTVGEVVGQHLAVTKWLKENVSPESRLTNIVYMGQGEPLHNYDNMVIATHIFLEEKGIGLGQRKITLSTSGLVPKIKMLKDFPPVNIAISLHASRNDIRSELMPINKVYDLDRLFDAIKTIPLKAHRHITFEYLLIKDLNDQKRDIEGLRKLLQKDISKINLIPFNEYPESSFKRPSDTHIKWFQDSLIGLGYICTTRTTKGTDILAACGQLKAQEDSLNLWEKN